MSHNSRFVIGFDVAGLCALLDWTMPWAGLKLDCGNGLRIFSLWGSRLDSLFWFSESFGFILKKSVRTGSFLLARLSSGKFSTGSSLWLFCIEVGILINFLNCSSCNCSPGATNITPEKCISGTQEKPCMAICIFKAKMSPQFLDSDWIKICLEVLRICTPCMSCGLQWCSRDSLCSICICLA